jgi:peptidoglycan/LPS O-acetylase OafA/YrhL
LVVITHVFSASLLWYSPPGIAKWPTWSARWWLVQSPLHILWAGPEMVPVFFILSGYVLTLPAVRRGNAWFSPSYYPRRLIRLYPTAWVAIGFAAVMHVIPAHTPQPHATGWLNFYAVPLTGGDTLKSVTLIGPEADLYGLTTALWTMRWEVIFSMLLPVIIAGALLTRGRPGVAVLTAGVCFLLICTQSADGAFVVKALHFLPIFALGVLMAIHQPPRRPRPDGAPERWFGVPDTVWSVSAILACVGLLTLGYWTINVDVSSTTDWVEAATMAGACMLVWLCRGDRIAIAAMSTRPSQWLGDRCYSLYLVHLPIVLSLAFAFHGRVNALALLAMSLVLSLIGADILFRVVEKPSITLSRRVGGATMRLGRRPAVS